ncbi:MAG: hypothetical protein AAF800_06920 [Planctomycetota bacterium]
MPETSTDGPDKSELEYYVERFNRFGVEFMVIGGQAANLLGSDRPTFDVDLCYRRSPDNLERLAACLRDLNVTLRNAPPDLPFQIDARSLALGANFTFSTELSSLDVLGHVEPIGDYDALLPNAETGEVAGEPVTVIGLDDLIRIKEHIARQKDRDALVELLAIKRLRAESSDGKPGS